MDYRSLNAVDDAIQFSLPWTHIRGGFRGGVRSVRPPPKIRKAYVLQR